MSRDKQTCVYGGGSQQKFGKVWCWLNISNTEKFQQKTLGWQSFHWLLSGSEIFFLLASLPVSSLFLVLVSFCNLRAVENQQFPPIWHQCLKFWIFHLQATIKSFDLPIWGVRLSRSSLSSDKSPHFPVNKLAKLYFSILITVKQIKNYKWH